MIHQLGSVFLKKFIKKLIVASPWIRFYYTMHRSLLLSAGKILCYWVKSWKARQAFSCWFSLQLHTIPCENPRSRWDEWKYRSLTWVWEECFLSNMISWRHTTQDVWLPGSAGNHGQGQPFSQLSKAAVAPSSYCRSKEFLGSKCILLMLSSPQMSSEMWQAAKCMGCRAGSTNAQVFRKSVDYIRKAVQKAVLCYRQIVICPSAHMAGLETQMSHRLSLTILPSILPLYGHYCFLCFLFLTITWFLFLPLNFFYKHAMNWNTFNTLKENRCWIFLTFKVKSRLKILCVLYIAHYMRILAPKCKIHCK